MSTTTAETRLDTDYPEGVQNVAFFINTQSPQLTGLKIDHIKATTTQPVSITAEIGRLELDEDGTQELVLRIARAMLEQWGADDAEQPQQLKRAAWGAAVFAVRTYAPREDELLKQLTRAAIIHDGSQTQNPSVLCQSALADRWHDESTLHDVIAHLVAAGWETTEISEVWARMLEKKCDRGFKPPLIWGEFWEKVRIDDELPKVPEAAAKIVLTEFRLLLEDGQASKVNHTDSQPAALPTWYFGMLETLIGQMDRGDATQGTVNDLFIAGFANGYAAVATMLLRFCGHRFGLIREHATARDDDSWVRVVPKLQRAALDIAEREQRFGIASALAEAIGETESADRLRARARELDQPVTLNHFLSIVYERD